MEKKTLFLAGAAIFFLVFVVVIIAVLTPIFACPFPEGCPLSFDCGVSEVGSSQLTMALQEICWKNQIFWGALFFGSLLLAIICAYLYHKEKKN